MIQPELNLSGLQPFDPLEKSDADILIWALHKSSRTFTPAAVLSAHLGKETDKRWDDRRIRAAAKASKGRILSAPGSTGYRLASNTSVMDYMGHEDRKQGSQIRNMIRRRIEMRKAVHHFEGRK